MPLFNLLLFFAMKLKVVKVTFQRMQAAFLRESDLGGRGCHVFLGILVLMPLSTCFQVFSVGVQIVMHYRVTNNYMYISSLTLKNMTCDEDCIPGQIEHRECRNSLDYSAGKG